MTNSASASFRILLVEDDGEYAHFIRVLLEGPDVGDLLAEADLVHVERLSAARTRLAQRDVDLVLLDLTLPDSQGLATVMALATEYPEVPIVVITGIADEAMALRALQTGAQDYLIKSEVDRRALFKSVRYSLERHRLQQQLRNLSLTDELTGLYNRRGFMTFAERQLKVARRRVLGAVAFVFDVDELKTINDRYGHAEGDRALAQIGIALRASFRDEDIIGRLGGDEFAVLALDVSGDGIDMVRLRLHAELARANAPAEQAYLLRVSTGWSRLEPGQRRALDSLLGEADGRLYRDKAAHATETIVKESPETGTSNNTHATHTPSRGRRGS